MSIGFVGGSIQSNIGYTHFCSSALDGLWRIEAGSFSRNQQKNLESAKTYQITDNRLYSNWMKMLDKELDSLDAVVVLTPTIMHSEIVKYALKLKYPVICEKPLATNLEDLKEIKNLEKKLDSFIAVTYNYTGYPMIRLLKKLIGDNILGDIFHFQIEMPQETFLRNDINGKLFSVENWRKKDFEIPTINLDLAVHMHQIIYYLTNRYPKSVIASNKTHNKNFDIIDNVNCLTKYSNNFDGHFWWSKSSLGYRNGLKVRLFGSDGAACWIQENPELLHLSFTNGKKEIIDRGDARYASFLEPYNRFKPGHPSGVVEAFANIYRDIHHSLNNHLNKYPFSSK